MSLPFAREDFFEVFIDQCSMIGEKKKSHIYVLKIISVTEFLEYECGFLNFSLNIDL